MQLNIIDPVERIIDSEGALAVIIRHWLPQNSATALYQCLSNNLPWESRRMHGHPIPRLSCALGDFHLTHYGYNTTRLTMNHWDDNNELYRTMRDIRDRITLDPILNDIVGQPLTYDSCLFQYYRTGQDSIDFHGDKEALGPMNAVVALSLGSTRTFHFKYNVKGPNSYFPNWPASQYPRIKVPVHNGDLMIMAGRCQELWQHGIPKDDTEGGRISATFRCIGR